MVKRWESLEGSEAGEYRLRGRGNEGELCEGPAGVISYAPSAPSCNPSPTPVARPNNPILASSVSRSTRFGLLLSLPLSPSSSIHGVTGVPSLSSAPQNGVPTSLAVAQLLDLPLLGTNGLATFGARGVGFRFFDVLGCAIGLN